MKLFKCRVNDIAAQNWHSDLLQRPKLETYSNFKSSLHLENYLKCGLWRRHQVALCKLRTSNHRLAVERLRHGRINVSRHDRVCQFCLNLNVTMVEDEYHFVMECPLYSHIRAQLLGNSVDPNTQHTFHELMKTNSIATLTRLACYTYHGLNIHKHFNDL